MKNSDQATHIYKRGEVIVLRSTAELAEIQIPSNGDHFWVRVTELTRLPDHAGGRRSPAHDR